MGRIHINKLGKYCIPWYLSLFRVRGGKFPEYELYMIRSFQDRKYFDGNVDQILVANIEKTCSASRSYWYTSTPGAAKSPDPLDDQVVRDMFRDFGNNDDTCLWMQIEKYFGISEQLTNCYAWNFMDEYHGDYNITIIVDSDELKQNLYEHDFLDHGSEQCFFSDGSSISFDETGYKLKCTVV